MSSAANKALSSILHMNRTGTIETVLAAVGSSDDFAACTLAHIRRSLLAHDYTSMLSTMMLLDVNEEIYISLLTQDVQHLVLDIIRDCIENPSPLCCGIFPLTFKFLLRTFTTPPCACDQVAQALERQILVLLLKTIDPRLASLIPTGFEDCYEDLPEILDILREHLIFRNNLRPVAKSLRTIRKHGLEPHLCGFEGLTVAWTSFEVTAKEMLVLKSKAMPFVRHCAKCNQIIESSTSHRCSVCYAYYCSKACQKNAWKFGGHRDVCYPNDVYSTRDMQFLSAVTSKHLTDFRPALSLIYQLYILTQRSLDPLLPLAVFIEATNRPPLITCGHRDAFLKSTAFCGSASRARSTCPQALQQFDKVQPDRLMTVFLLLPNTSDINALLVFESEVRLTLPFTTYPEFVRSKRAIIGQDSELLVLAMAAEELTQKLELEQRRGKVVLKWIGHMIPFHWLSRSGSMRYDLRPSRTE